jgi:tetratricopeptide (TPR) repeat protein
MQRRPDFQGIDVSLSQDLSEDEAKTVISSINQFCEQVLRYGKDWHVIERAAATDPSCVLALVFAADYEVAKERMDKARAHLERARKVADASEVTEREKLYVDAFYSWMAGDLPRAYADFKRITELYPMDLFALKRGQLVAFCVGDRAGMLEIALAMRDTSGDRPYFNGMLCFALEQNGRYDEALAAGKRGVEIAEDDPWAHHSVAHALLSLDRPDEGVAWLSKYAHYWEDCMSFMHTHNWFHLALFHLSQSNHSEIESIYYPHIFLTDEAQQQMEAAKKDESFPAHDNRNTQDQLGAMGLLWKWELMGGHGLEPKWRQLLPYVEDRRHGHADPFYDVLLLHTLLRMGKREEAREMVAEIEKATESLPSPRKEQLNQVWVPLCKGIYAYETGHKEEGLKLLNEAHLDDHLHVIGGSNEQREVVHDYHRHVAQQQQQQHQNK